MRNKEEIIKKLREMFPLIQEVKTFEENKEYIEIYTSFLDTRNDHIAFYLSSKKGEYRFTDSSETLENYTDKFDYSKLIEAFADNVMGLPFVGFDGSRIESFPITEEKFNETVLYYIQALILCNNIRWEKGFDYKQGYEVGYINGKRHYENKEDGYVKQK